MFQRLQVFRALPATGGAWYACFLARIGSIGEAHRSARRRSRCELFEFGAGPRSYRAQSLPVLTHAAPPRTGRRSDVERIDFEAPAQYALQAAQQRLPRAQRGLQRGTRRALHQ